MAEARDVLADLEEAERMVWRRLQDRLDEAQSLEDRAVSHLRDDDEARAHAALKDKHRVDRDAEKIRAELDEHQRRIAELRDALRRLGASEAPVPTRRADARRKAASPAPMMSGSPAPSGGSYYQRYSGRGPSRETADSERGDRPPPPGFEPVGSRAATSLGESVERDAGIEAAFGVGRSDDAFSRFQEMEARISGLEAEMGAERALASNASDEDPLRDDLDERFEELEARDRQRELERLKRKAEETGTDILDRLRRRMESEDE